MGLQLPITQWLPRYNRQSLSHDVTAAVFLTIMLVPQSLAFALLAGLPAQVGLYACLLPLLLYTLFGTSQTMSVGPVALIALMTAATLGPLYSLGSAEYLTGAVLLAFLSGAMLIVMGLLRLGFLANFLSHPVISGFITASALVIIASQLQHLLGLDSRGHNLIGIGSTLWQQLSQVHGLTLVMSAGVLLFLLLARTLLAPALQALGLAERSAAIISKSAPIVAVLGATLLTWGLDLQARGLAVVGEVPRGLPPLSLPPLAWEQWQPLWLGALLIAVVGFVQSLSVAQMLAARKRQHVDPNQELLGLGVANLGAGFSSGMPVMGSLSRSVMAYDAGARTPATGAFTALAIALATLFLTPAIAYLPIATLAAIIIVSVASLVDIAAIKRTFHYGRPDFIAMLATLVLTLVHSVATGLMVGVGLSLALYIYRTSNPHTAVLGRVPGTEHFRNTERHRVEVYPDFALLRVDESLYFANARFLEDTVMTLVSEKPQLKDLVLVCPAVNLIDASALDSLDNINARLQDAKVRLHLSEVKGPVMDQLNRTHFPATLTGQVFLSTYAAWCALRPEPGDASSTHTSNNISDNNNP
ncbi:MAG: sulfate permease [Halomonadaceae bacterium]|nr:MAG: sulfate permease [Halomonadaceae bacterium]